MQRLTGLVAIMTSIQDIQGVYDRWAKYFLAYFNLFFHDISAAEESCIRMFTACAADGTIAVRSEITLNRVPPSLLRFAVKTAHAAWKPNGVRSQDAANVAEALPSLPCNERSAFILCQSLQVSLTDVANALDVDLATAKEFLWRAFLNLRKTLLVARNGPSSQRIEPAPDAKPQVPEDDVFYENAHALYVFGFALLGVQREAEDLALACLPRDIAKLRTNGDGLVSALRLLLKRVESRPPFKFSSLRPQDRFLEDLTVRERAAVAARSFLHLSAEQGGKLFHSTEEQEQLFATACTKIKLAAK